MIVELIIRVYIFVESHEHAFDWDDEHDMVYEHDEYAWLIPWWMLGCLGYAWC